MRIFVKIFLFAAACHGAFAAGTADSGNSATAKDFVERGASFYARGDYAAAKELFRQVKLDGSQTSGIAAYLLGSIYANEGSPDAFKMLEYAAAHAPDGMDVAAGVQCAKISLINGKPEIAKKSLEKFASANPADAQVAWYYSQSLWELGEKSQAKRFFESALKKDFGEISAIGVDIFIDAKISGDEFAESIDISGLRGDSAVAVSRLEMLSGKKITPKQSDLSLLGQIEKIDQNLRGGAGDFDVAALEESLKKYSSAPYSWRAALILSEYYTSKKEYEKGAVFAKNAQLLAPPEIEYQGRLLIAEGDALRLMKKYAAADSAYLKVVMNRHAKGEIAAEATYKVGINWFEQGDWAKAHVYFERVFVLYFHFEYWGARAYYYDARALFSLGERRDANATLIEYFRRAKDRKSEIYKEARKFYNSI